MITSTKHPLSIANAKLCGDSMIMNPFEEQYQSAVEEERSRFVGPHNTEELIACAEELCLRNQPFEGKIVDVFGSPDKFCASVELQIHDLIQLECFLGRYTMNNGETLRIAKSQKLTSRSQYSIVNYYRCQHNTRVLSTRNVSEILEKKPSKRLKNTNCPFKLSVKIMKQTDSESYPCKVKIEWCHNHEIDTLQANSFKDLANDVTTRIRQYFMDGMTPGTAYREFVSNLRLTHQDNLLDFHKALADRSLCPRRRDFNKLYSDFNLEKYGGSNCDIMLNILEDNIAKLKTDFPHASIQYSLCDENNPLILAFVTPMMHRIHQQVQEAGEMVFIDSSSNMEEYNMRVFLIVTQSVVGALPLGVLICSNEQTETLIRGFTLLKNCFNEQSFYGKGHQGPDIAMTDNCSELHDALQVVWPSMKILLCLFHMLKQVWSWLNDKTHSICHSDKPHILQQFKSVMYATSQSEFDEKYEIILTDEITSGYPLFQNYFVSVCEYKDKWACIYRLTETIRGSNTNNFVEAQFNVIKDGILKRCKEYNINGLFVKLLYEFNNHYETKLLSVASGRFDGVYSRRFQGKSKKGKKLKSTGMGFITPDEVQQKKMIDGSFTLGSSVFIVPSATDHEVGYVVDMINGICSCAVGCNGSPCKHQYVIWCSRKSQSKNFLPYFDKRERQKYAMIAIGETLPLRSYESLHEKLIADAPSTINYNTINASTEFDNVPIDFETEDDRQSINVIIENESDDFQGLKEEAKNALKENLNFLIEQIDSGEKSLATGVIKFVNRCKSIPTSRLPSSFHEFGNNILEEKSKKKRKSFTKIAVQPGSVKRRKSESGSRQRQSSGRKVLLQPTKRRPHNFAACVRKNQAVATKSRCVMSTKTRLKCSKATQSSLK